MIHFLCQGCGEAIAAPEAVAGRPQVCPLCGATVVVPPPQAIPVGPPPAGALAAAPPKRSRGLAIVALILGICGFIPCLTVLTVPPGIILGIVVLAKRRAGRWLAIGGIAAGVVSLGLILWLMASFLSRDRELGTQTECAANLHQIGLAVLMYKADNQEMAPPDLDALADYDVTVSRALNCPSCAVAGNVDYFYFPLPVEARANPLMACDFKANHAGEDRSVLFADGAVGRMKEAGFQAELSKPENAAFAAALAEAEGP